MNKQNFKALKAHHHLAITSMLIFGMVSVWTWGAVVFAGSNSSGTTVTVQIGPPDACPNIPGYQESVPPGMLVDGDGNCYTPPPPPTDVCPNIAGVQTVIPDGYYLDANGDCQPQPDPPIDVCPNLPGMQETVPDGYISTEDGRCIEEPLDMCDNITGPQYLVPEGLERASDGTCFTPDPDDIVPPTDEPSPWVAPTEPRRPSGLRNVPAALVPILMPIIDAIPETVKEALRSTPPIVAQTFPYYIFAVLGVATAVMGFQSVSEIAASRRLMLLVKRERDIAEEKDSFIALASHYLRTPLTVMKGALDTSRATGELTEEALTPLRTAMNNLEVQIGQVLGSIETNEALKDIPPPLKTPVEKQSFLRSAYFWAPIVLSLIIVLLSNFLLGVVGDVQLGTVNLIAQTLTFLTVSLLFYSALRTHYVHRHEHAYREKLLRHEEVIDTARNDFISQSTMALAKGLGAINKERGVLTGMKSENYFIDGHNRFAHLLEKFMLLGEIQAGVVGQAEKFDLVPAINNIISRYQSQLDEKGLTVVNNVNAGNISQRHTLFDFVLSSLIDNAIKFSNEGGTITINSTPHEHTLTVQISDYGVAIPESKMSQLFKPFSRGSNVMEFNYEGLGFSLFLDKIIMDYVGGSISAKSIEGDRTTFSVTTVTS